MLTRRTRAWDAGRPVPPYTIHEDHWQADQLAMWWPFCENGGPANNHGHRGRRPDFDLSPASAPWKADRNMGLVPDFNGSSSVLEGSGVSGSEEPQTLVVWFTSRSSTASQTLLSCNDGTGGNGLYLQARGDQGGDPIFALKQDGGNFPNASSAVGYTTNQWHHACGVFGAVDSRAAYLDGRHKGTDTTACVSRSTAGVYIGAFRLTSGLTSFLDGQVADARLYKRALSDAEVYALYNQETRWDLYYPLGRRVHVFLGDGGPVGGDSVGAGLHSIEAGLMAKGLHRIECGS